MSVDVAQFCLYRNPTNCLLSMNKSARRCALCNESVKHDKSVKLDYSRVKTDIELMISLVFSAWEHIKSVTENKVCEYDRKNRQTYDDAFFNLNQINQLGQRFRFFWLNRSYCWLACDVIIFQNPKPKSHQSFYPHQALDGENWHLVTTFQLGSLLRLETSAFWISELWRCVT